MDLGEHASAELSVGPHHHGPLEPDATLKAFLSDPRVTKLPSLPYAPQFVLDTPALVCFLSTEEKAEILGYDRVYTVGRVSGSRKKSSSSAAASDTNGTLAQRYEGVPNDHIAYRFLCNKVEGRGTFAVVLSATDEKNQSQQVALKVLSILPNHNAEPVQHEKMIEQEISILRTLSQSSAPDNFVKFFERVEFRQHTVLVFELLGVDLETDLHNRYRSGRGYTLTEVQGICRQMVCALQCMQSKSIVHADLKPNNVMININDDGAVQLKVIDFGRAFEEAHGPHSGWSQNASYAAPDKVLGCHIGPGVDQFAAGCIAFELLTGERLFNVPRDITHWQQMFCYLSALGKPSTGIAFMPCKFKHVQRYFHSRAGNPRDEICRAAPGRSVVLLPPNYISQPATLAHRLVLKQAPAHAVSFVLSLLAWEPEKRQLAFSHCFLDAGAHINSCSSQGCGDHICCHGFYFYRARPNRWQLHS